MCVSPQQFTIDDRAGAKGIAGLLGAKNRDLRPQRVQLCWIAEIDPAGIAPIRIQCGRCGQTRMRIGLQALELRDGIADDFDYGNLIIHEAIDEGGVGAILEKTPHEIGEQVLMFSHRGIHAHPRKIGHLTRRFGVQQPAHAMQPLKLKVRARRCQLQHRGNAVGVMRRELRIDQVMVFKEAPHAGQIGHIGGHLAGVDRIAVKTPFLGPLDLGVPIRAFHQTHRHAAAVLPGRGRNPIDHVRGALAVGLHRKPEPRPFLGDRILRESLDNVQREIESIRFLGIDGQLNAEARRLAGELLHLRYQPLHDPLVLQQAIARLQRRELDGNAGHIVNRTPRNG